MTTKPLVQKQTDAELAAEADKLFKSTRKLQFIAALIDYLRANPFPWFTAEHLRDAFPALMRMQWYEPRADLRQEVVHAITGMKMGKALYGMSPDQHAACIDPFLDAGDVDLNTFDQAFRTDHLVVLGKPELYWFLFRAQVALESVDERHKELMSFLITEALAKVDSLDPIITEVDVLNAFPAELLEEKLPFEKRVHSRTTRRAYQSEEPPKTYTAADEYADIGGVDTLVHCLDLTAFVKLLDVIESSMNFVQPTSDTPSEDPNPTDEHSTPTVAPAPMSNDGPASDKKGPIATALAIRPPSKESQPRLPAVQPGAEDKDNFDEAFAAMQGPKGDEATDAAKGPDPKG